MSDLRPLPAPAPKSDTDAPLTNRGLLLFSVTNYGKSVYWTIGEVFLLVFATDTLGLSPAVAGLILLVALIWDAVSDPAAGLLIDRVGLLKHRLSDTIRLSALFTALCVLLIFSTQFIHSDYRSALFCLSVFLFRTGFTLIDIPDNALFARLAQDRRSRVVGASGRKFLASLGAVSISLSSAWALSDQGGLTEGVRVFIVTAACSAVAVCAIFFGTRQVRHAEVLHRPGLLFFGSLPALVRHCQPAVALLIHMFFSTLSMSLILICMIYYTRYILGNFDLVGTMLTTYFVCQLLAVAAWAPIALRVDIGVCLISLCVLLALSSCLLLYAESPLALAILAAATGFFAGGLNSLRWALAPEAVSAIQRASQQQPEALIMAFFSVSIKCAAGIASLVMGSVLYLLAYEPGRTASVEDAATFRAAMAAICGLSALLATLPLFLVLVAGRGRAHPVASPGER